VLGSNRISHEWGPWWYVTGKSAIRVSTGGPTA